MGDFNRDRRFGGERDFKRRDFGSSGSSDRPQMMHKAICSDCGKECEVPFKPSGSKPVFCRDCFQNKRASGSVRPENFPRPVEQPQYTEKFESLNAKLDKILNLLTPKETAREVETSEPIQIPEVEVPVVKKKRVSRKITS